METVRTMSNSKIENKDFLQYSKKRKSIPKKSKDSYPIIETSRSSIVKSNLKIYEEEKESAKLETFSNDLKVPRFYAMP